MASNFGPQLKEEARPFLESGEEILASIVAQPRGTSNSKAGGLAPQAIGGAWAGKSRKTAEQAGLEITKPDGPRGQPEAGARLRDREERDGQAQGR